MTTHAFDAVARWDRESLEQIPIPQEAKTYLQATGLPRRVAQSLQFGPPLTLVDDAPFPAWTLGHDYETPIAVDEAGRVFAVPSRRVVIPMNGSVAQLGACLAAYAVYVREVSTLDEEEIDTLIDRVEQLMTEADAESLGNPSGYWAAIVEQMWDGLL